MFFLWLRAISDVSQLMNLIEYANHELPLNFILVFKYLVSPQITKQFDDYLVWKGSSKLVITINPKVSTQMVPINSLAILSVALIRTDYDV